MIDTLVATAPLALPVALLVIGTVVGWAQERRHSRSLVEREAALGPMTVSAAKTPPPGTVVTHAEMVSGNVVIGAHRGRELAARLRNLLGGRVRSFEKVVARARQDAYLRMLEEARALGAATVINVRFETAQIGGLAAEVLCYGTALQTAGGVRRQ